MSYASTSTQASITVQGGFLALTVKPNPPWVPGQTLTFFVLLSTPAWLTDTVTIYANGTSIASIQISGLSGSTTWTIPQSYAGQSMSFTAKDTLFGATSNAVSGSILYPTKISISAPSTVYVNQTFNVSGTLQYENSSGSWAALSGATVTVRGSWGGSATATTNSSGQYTATLTAPSSSGTYMMMASFAGSSSVAAVTGYSPLAVSSSPTALPTIASPNWAWCLACFAAGAVVGGLIGYGVARS